MTETTSWVKASASASGGECAEMRRHAGRIEVRDTKDREGPVLRFTTAGFAAWLDAARNGEFDHLT